RPARVEGARQIGVDHRPPVLVRHSHQQAVARQAGVVDEDVEVARLVDEPRRLLADRDVSQDGTATDLGRERLGLVRAAAVADDDVGARRRQLRRNGAADPARGAGDESELAVEPAETAIRHAEASSSLIFSSDRRSLTGIAFTLRSIRFSRPESTFPGPTSTNVRTPSLASSDAACVNRTGAVSWSTSSAPIRCASSNRAVTVDMNAASGSLNLTRSIAGRSRSAARATSGEWNAPDTFSFTVRRAPSSSAFAHSSSTASCSPETTIWPGQL